jgi:hypothetical protein
LSSLLSAEPEADSLVLVSIFVFFVVIVVLAFFSGLGRNHRGLKLLPVQRLKDSEATAF